MKSLIIVVCISTLFFGLVTAKKSDVEFVILITSYNNESCAKKNIASVAYLKSSRPYEVICINDNSRDKTRFIMTHYVDKHNLSSFIHVIDNEERVGALANIYNAVHTYIPDHKVVVSVDGDDFLLSDDVLLRLE